MIVIGLLGLVVGGKWVVDGAITIAQKLKISEFVIAVTVIPGGTSLPELATSIVTAIKKEYDISVGNIVGSNIFNILAILGVTGLYQVSFEMK